MTIELSKDGHTLVVHGVDWSTAAKLKEELAPLGVAIDVRIASLLEEARRSEPVGYFEMAAAMARQTWRKAETR